MKRKMRNILKFTTLSMVLLGCGTEDNPELATKTLVYNHAYQENYQSDTIEDILLNAKDAYVLIDPFNEDSYRYIGQIKEGNNQVAGYISVGTGESWREDFSELKPYLSDRVWSNWEGEYFVDDTNSGILEVMKKRIDKMEEWGVDWIEFDNMDWASEENIKEYTLNITKEESMAYVNSLCDYTHAKGMKYMAKSVVDGFEQFDGVLYESASDNKYWWREEGMKSFLNRKELVIINHYNETDCDKVYDEYQTYYKSENISFICEDIGLKKYKHYTPTRKNYIKA